VSSSIEAFEKLFAALDPLEERLDQRLAVVRDARALRPGV